MIHLADTEGKGGCDLEDFIQLMRKFGLVPELTEEELLEK